MGLTPRPLLVDLNKAKAQRDLQPQEEAALYHKLGTLLASLGACGAQGRAGREPGLWRPRCHCPLA